MGLLDSLASDAQKHSEYQDFIDRYQQGAPHEGITEQEAVQRHDEVASELSPEQYRQAATDALARMPESDRLAIGQHLQQAAAGGQFSHADLQQADESKLKDPGFLGSVLGSMHGRSSGLLSSLLGGAIGGGALGSGMSALSGMMGRGGPWGGAGLTGNLKTGLLAGIAAMAVRRFLGSRVA